MRVTGYSAVTRTAVPSPVWRLCQLWPDVWREAVLGTGGTDATSIGVQAVMCSAALVIFPAGGVADDG